MPATRKYLMCCSSGPGDRVGNYHTITGIPCQSPSAVWNRRIMSRRSAVWNSFNFSALLITFFAVFILCAPHVQASPSDKWLAFFDNNGAAMLLIDPEDGRILRSNRAAVAFYGYSKAELESKSIQEINTFTEDQVKEERLQAAREHRNYFIFRHKLADDSIRRVEVFSNPIGFQGRTVLWSTIHDVSNTRLVQETLDHYSRELEEQVDRRTRQLRYLQWFLLVLVILQFLVIAALLHSRAKRRKADQALKDLNADLEARIAKAIQEIREKETIIHEHAKRKARDELLIDLAHHWRQPINTAALEVQNILDLMDGNRQPEKVEELVNIVVHELTDLSRTISHLTHFYEKDAGSRIDIRDGLEKTRMISLPALRARGVEIVGEIASDCSILAEAIEWVDFFSVFFINSREAGDRNGRGAVTLTIRAHRVAFGAEIVIEDNAGGIDPAMLPDRIFEAFSTTHSRSRDRGLGLFTVHSIVTYRWGGTIQAQNIEGGARFTIRIPDE